MKLKYLFVLALLMTSLVSANYEGYVLSVQKTTNPSLQESIKYFQDLNKIPIKTSANLQDKVIVISVADNNELARSIFGTWNRPKGYWEIREFGDDIFIMGTTEKDVVKALQSLNERKSPADYSKIIVLTTLLLLVSVGTYFFIKLDVLEKIVNKTKFKQKESPLQKYVKTMRKKGFSDEKIRTVLLNAGWKKEDLNF